MGISAGSGGDGGSGGGGAIAGVALVGGLAAIIWGDTEPVLTSSQPDPLALEGGDPAAWADAQVESVSVNLITQTADVQLSTRAGKISRQMKLQDGGDGANHYAWQDNAGNRAMLSVNSQTREYFYTETGANSNKLYMAKAHGWLQRGATQVAAR